MKKIIYTFLCISCLLTSGCYKKFTEPVPEQWQPLDLKTEFPIENVYAGNQELYLGTPGEFVRINGDNEVVEQRQLNTGERVYGRPMLSENVFVRIIRPPQSQNKQTVEFHLARSTLVISKHLIVIT